MPRLPLAYRIHHDLQYVGKLIKMAKRRVTWKFAFEGDDDEHSVVLQHTLNSGKKVIFLNGNQIFEEEKLSAGDFVYPFQLDGHLITIVIVAQVGDEGMYDCRVDGRSFLDMRYTTLEDLRARAKGQKATSDPAWSKGGGVVGAAADNYGSNEAEATHTHAEPVATLSMKDFVGNDSKPSASHAAASGGGVDAFSAAAAGGAWDPFSGQGGGDGGFGGFGSDPFTAPAPAPVAAPAPAPAPAPALKKPTTSTTAATTALRAPTAPAVHKAAAPAPAAAPAYDPFSDPAPAAAAPAASLADDFAGLSFGGPAPAAARPASAGARPASAGSSGMGMGMADPFGMGSLGGAAAAPVANAPRGGGGLDDLFGSSAPVASTTGPSAGSAGLNAFGGIAMGGAVHAKSASGGLVDLDNLTAAKPTAAAPSGPTLGQLSKGPGEKKNVMGGSGLSGASAAVALGGLDFGLGMPMAAPAPAPMGMGMGQQRPMGQMGMGMGQPMGGMGMGMGMGGQAGYGMGQPMGQGIGMGGGFGMAAPAPAPKPAAEYNPFE